MRDNHTASDIVLALAQGNITAATNGADVDLLGCNAVSFTVFVDNSNDTLSTTNKWTVKFQEADDNGSGAPGTYADVSAAKHVLPVGVTSLDITAKNARYEYGCQSIKRWVRLVLTPSGTHASGSGVMAVAHRSHLQAEGKGW